MSTIDSILKSIRMTEEMTRSILPPSTMLVAMSNANELNELAKSMEEKTKNLERMLIKLEWPPPGDLPASLADRITRLFESGQLEPSDVDELFVSAYDAERLTAILHNWRYDACSP